MIVKIVILALVFRAAYYRFESMARKSWFVITLICCFTTIQPLWSQILKNATISIDSVIILTTNMLNPKMIDQAKIRIDSLMNLISGQKNQKDLLMQLKIRSLQGKYLLQKQKNEDWPELYEWCKNQEALCQSEEELNLMVRLYNNAGIAFKRLGRLSDSEEAFLKSSDVLKKLKNPDYSLYGSVYANAGNSLKQIGEFDRSIEYLEQSIEYFNEFVEKSTTPNAVAKIAESKSKALDNLGLVYQCLADHQKAIDVFHTCIDIKLKYFPKDIIGVYGNLVISLIEVGNYTEAKHFINLIINDFKSGMAVDRSWALAKLNLADINFKLSGDTTGIFRDLDFLNQKIRNEIPSALDIAIIANQLAANLLKDQGKHQNALNKWSEAMKLLSSTNQNISPEEIPYNIKTLKFNKLIELMNLNAQVYYNWGKHNKDSDILKKAEERYSFTLKLIDSLRNSLELQSSKLQVSRMQRSTYNQLIEMEYAIFQLTGDSSYIDRLFTTMEQSKSAGLWSSVRDIEFKTSLIPQVDLEKENNIRKKITDIQGKIIEAGSAQNFEQKRIRDLQQENLFYNQQIDSLIRIYRQKYPDYYQAKFDRSTISLDKVGDLLTQEQVLIEYAIAYDYLYTLTVSRSGTNITRIPITQKLTEDIVYILNFMKGNVESLTSSARSRYCEAASGLFDLLIGSSVALINSKELLIIPDGSLSYIPFEALLEPQTNGSKQDYRKLPYLIHNHSISYGLTATVFFYKSARLAKPTRRVLAVAPSYNLSSGKISDYIRKAESGLPELKGTFQESRAIKKMLGGRLLIGAEATESTFKSIGPKYSILHLAMHTIPDKNNSLNSSLVFTPGADKKEDGVLFGHEVYNLSLNAWLTVLSACETGSGQMASGEGVLSFGRAFIVAGCPNLIMTMWTVDDRSSREIMVTFYQSLLSGAGIADALQKSKLAYLEHVDQLHAHPHYWAGFIELGQNQVLNISYKKPGLIYLLLFFPITVLILVFLQVKKNPRRSRDIMKSK